MMEVEEISPFRAILNLLRNILIFTLFMAAFVAWVTWDSQKEHFENIKILSAKGEKFTCEIVQTREWNPSDTTRRAKRRSRMSSTYYGTFLCNDLYAGIHKRGYPYKAGETVFVLLNPGRTGCLINTEKKPFFDLLIENWSNRSCQRVTPEKELEIRNQFSRKS